MLSTLAILIGIFLLPLNQSFDFESMLNKGIFQVAWGTADDTLLAISVTGIYEVDTQSIEKSAKQVNSVLPIFAADYSPDDLKLAVASRNIVSIYQFESDQSNIIGELIGHNADVLSVRWSPNGNYILTTSFDEGNTLRLWDAVTFEERLRLEYGELQMGVWSPDSTEIAVVNTNNGGVFILDIAESIEKQAMIHKHIGPSGLEAGRASSVAWNSLSRTVAIGHDGGTIYFVDTESDRTITTIKAHEGWIGALDFSADGLFIASAGADGWVRVWEVATGQLRSEYSKGDLVTNRIEFSPYGGRLAFGIANDVAEATDFLPMSVAYPSVVVPIPDLARLQQIATLCVRDAPSPEALQGLLASLSEASISDFVNSVSALTPDFIPPACKADIISIGSLFASG